MGCGRYSAASRLEVLLDVTIPGTLKSMSISSSWMDFGPSTGLTVLVECLVPSRPNKTSFAISWVNGCSTTGLTVLDNWGFWFWLDSLGVLAASSDF